jgi:hypothetical protein
MAALGVSFSAYQRFQALTPVATRFMDGRTEYRAPEGYEPSSEEYGFCLQFVVAVSLRLAELDANVAPPVWMPPADQWGGRKWATVAEVRRE